MAETITALEGYSDRCHQQTRLVPIRDCEELLATMEARSAPCVSQVSLAYVERLMGFCRTVETTSAELMVQGLTAMFCAYPEDLVRRVCDPVTGLPSRSKFPIGLADVKEALEAEKKTRDRLAMTARWTLGEHERRRREVEDEARYSPEHRRRIGAKMKGLADELRATIPQADGWNRPAPPQKWESPPDKPGGAE